MVTESFLPTLNGVTTSVCRVAQSLRARGPKALIIAARPGVDDVRRFRVRGLPSILVCQFPIGVPTPALRRTLEEFKPDVIHAASPFIRGVGAPARPGARSDACTCTPTSPLAPSRATLADLRSRGVARTDLWARNVATSLFSPRWHADAGTLALPGHSLPAVRCSWATSGDWRPRGSCGASPRLRRSPGRAS